MLIWVNMNQNGHLNLLITSPPLTITVRISLLEVKEAQAITKLVHLNIGENSITDPFPHYIIIRINIILVIKCYIHQLQLSTLKLAIIIRKATIQTNLPNSLMKKNTKQDSIVHMMQQTLFISKHIKLSKL